MIHQQTAYDNVFVDYDRTCTYLGSGVPHSRQRRSPLLSAISIEQAPRTGLLGLLEDCPERRPTPLPPRKQLAGETQKPGTTVSPERHVSRECNIMGGCDSLSVEHHTISHPRVRRAVLKRAIWSKAVDRQAGGVCGCVFIGGSSSDAAESSGSFRACRSFSQYGSRVLIKISHPMLFARATRDRTPPPSLCEACSSVDRQDRGRKSCCNAACPLTASLYYLEHEPMSHKPSLSQGSL